MKSLEENLRRVSLDKYMTRFAARFGAEMSETGGDKDDADFL